MPAIPAPTITALSDTVRFERTIAFSCRIDADKIPRSSAHTLVEFDGECHRHIGQTSTFKVELSHTADEILASASVYLDSSQKQQSKWAPVGKGLHHLSVSFTRASGPKVDDGSLELRVDGKSVSTLSDLAIFWRHHPAFYSLDKSLTFGSMVHVGTTIPAAHSGPVVMGRRRVRKRRR